MDDLKVFVAVVTAGGFTAGANSLEMTVTATSRRIKALEQRLGIRLLNRTTRQVSLTEAGQVYYDQARLLLADLRATEAQLSQLRSEPVGQIRATAPVSIGAKRLAPLISRFIQQHSRLQVQLQLDDRFIDIVAEGFDVALRIGYPQDSSLIMRSLIPIPRYVCASPDYLARHGRPEQPIDLIRHDCLHYNNVSVRDEWTFNGDNGLEVVEVQGTFCSNNGDALCMAAAEGLGVVLLPDFLVEEQLRTHRLERLLEGFEPPPFELFALYPSRQFVPRKIQLFLDYLTAALVSPIADLSTHRK